MQPSGSVPERTPNAIVGRGARPAAGPARVSSPPEQIAGTGLQLRDRGWGDKSCIWPEEPARGLHLRANAVAERGNRYSGASNPGSDREVRRDTLVD
jgi:hypothetical protein